VLAPGSMPDRLLLLLLFAAGAGTAVLIKDGCCCELLSWGLRLCAAATGLAVPAAGCPTFCEIAWVSLPAAHHTDTCQLITPCCGLLMQSLRKFLMHQHRTTEHRDLHCNHTVATALLQAMQHDLPTRTCQCCCCSCRLIHNRGSDHEPSTKVVPSQHATASTNIQARHTQTPCSLPC